MNEQIFRKKSLDKVKSPENLDDYIRVSNPGVWLLLVCVLVLLIGACVWGAFGHIDSILPSIVCFENGNAVCFIAEEDISSVKTGLNVQYEGQKALITGIGEKEDMGFRCTLSVDSALPDGFYDGKIVIQSYKPLSFILN